MGMRRGTGDWPWLRETLGQFVKRRKPVAPAAPAAPTPRDPEPPPDPAPDPSGPAPRG
jgi:hypothetical protein